MSGKSVQIDSCLTEKSGFDNPWGNGGVKVTKGGVTRTGARDHFDGGTNGARGRKRLGGSNPT